MFAHRDVGVVRDFPAGVFAQKQAPPPRVGTKPVTVGGKLHGAIDQLIERPRIAVADARQVLADLLAELRPAHRRVEVAFDLQEPLRKPDVNDFGAGVPHRIEPRLDRPIHLAVNAHEVPRHAKTRPGQGVGVQELRVVLVELPGAPRRRRVRFIHANHRSQRDGDVVDASRHGSAGVKGKRQGHDAVPAQEPKRRFESRQAIRGGRPANGASGVRTQPDKAVSGGYGRPGATGGAGRRAGRIVRIAGDPPERAHGAPGSELAQVHLRQHDRAGLPQFPHHEGVIGRARILQQEGSRGRGNVRGVEVVLEQDRNPVKGRPAA